MVDKLSVTKNLECLRFLTDCGICIDGIDLNDKKQNISNIKTIKITYPDDPIMLTGLKVMAIAETDYGTLVNQDIFLRCDYRILKKDGTDVFTIVKDTIKPLSADVHIYIKYCYKRKDLWGINASLNNGYHINVKPTKTDEYKDTIKTFSPILQELIAKGYGCGICSIVAK